MKNIYNTENHHNSKQGCYENVVKFCCILRLLNRDERLRIIMFTNNCVTNHLKKFLLTKWLKFSNYIYCYLNL